MPHFPKPAEGSWTAHYPHLAVNFINAIKKIGLV